MRGWPRARSGSHGPGCTPGSTTWCTSKAKEYKVDALHLTFYMAFFSHWNIAYLELRCRHDDSLFACFWTVCFLEQKRWEFIKKKVDLKTENTLSTNEKSKNQEKRKHTRKK